LGFGNLICPAAFTNGLLHFLASPPTELIGLEVFELVIEVTSRELETIVCFAKPIEARYPEYGDRDDTDLGR
jgi:hypothetical protein